MVRLYRNASTAADLKERGDQVAPKTTEKHFAEDHSQVERLSAHQYFTGLGTDSGLRLCGDAAGSFWYEFLNRLCDLATPAAQPWPMTSGIASFGCRWCRMASRGSLRLRGDRSRRTAGAETGWAFTLAPEPLHHIIPSSI